MSHSIKSDKAALRKQIKSILNNIEPGEVEEQSRWVTKKVLELPAYVNAKAISIFLSMPGQEISTSSIVLDALHKGKMVFIPYIHSCEDDPKSKTMDMLRLRDESDLRDLKPDSWGIPSLSSAGIDDRENALDLIFMPGMAFDEHNNRLGHGKGFYDRYLSRLDENSHENASPVSHPVLVGLALREQILAEGQQIPVDENDWKIDQIVVAD